MSVGGYQDPETRDDNSEYEKNENVIALNRIVKWVGFLDAGG